MQFAAEADYRKAVQHFFTRLQELVDGRDPDEAECEINQGTLRLTFPSGNRLILSQQPSLQEIWLAIEAEAKGVHYKFNGQNWIDEKTQKLQDEIQAYYLKETKHSPEIST